MIFKQAQQVVDGRKRQTRRPVKQNEMLVYATSAKPSAMFSHVQDDRFSIPTVVIFRPGHPVWEDDFVRLKWQVGRDYAVQPGRGKKSIGRTPPIKAIRRERLQEISLEDIGVEGITTPEEFARIWGEAITRSWLEVAYERLKKGDLRNAFRYMWRSIYKKPYRWEDNPEVWALEFEPVEDFEEFIRRETEAAMEGGIIDPNTGLPFELAEPEEEGE